MADAAAGGGARVKVGKSLAKTAGNNKLAWQRRRLLGKHYANKYGTQRH
jgi:CTP:molybdopterin cytidylyltransferase MocA